MRRTAARRLSSTMGCQADGPSTEEVQAAQHAAPIPGPATGDAAPAIHRCSARLPDVRLTRDVSASRATKAPATAPAVARQSRAAAGSKLPLARHIHARLRMDGRRARNPARAQTPANGRSSQAAIRRFRGIHPRRYRSCLHACHPPAADGWAQSTNRGAADTLNGRSVAGAFRGVFCVPPSAVGPPASVWCAAPAARGRRRDAPSGESQPCAHRALTCAHESARKLEAAPSRSRHASCVVRRTRRPRAGAATRPASRIAAGTLNGRPSAARESAAVDQPVRQTH